MSEQNTSSQGLRAALGVGLATLVTVLITVLLTTFAVLALVSARADLNLSNKTIAATTAYYAADAQAELWLAEIDAQLQTSTLSPSSALVNAGYQVNTVEGRPMLTNTFEVDENRELIVELVINNNGDIGVHRWQVTAKLEQ